MKKNIITFLAAFMLLASFSFSASAASVNSGKTAYELCNVSKCEIVGLHYHDNVVYNGHYYGDGHEHSEDICPIDKCSNYGNHMYNGESCYSSGHNTNKTTNRGHMRNTTSTNSTSNDRNYNGRGNCCRY